MSKGEAIFGVVLFFVVLDLLQMLIAGGGSSNNSGTNSANGGRREKDKEKIRRDAPNKIKCRCTECNQIVLIPKQYLQDLTYTGPQTAKCPNCGWKMRKVEIIQTWGLR